jgi:tetratricopeptide (TPR) repeat protein
MRRASLWCAVALVSAVTGSTARAEERASVVQEQQPEPKRSLVTQSGRLLAAGDANGALAKAEAAVQAEPQSGFAHYCKAEALASLNQYEAAVTAYETAVAKLPAGEVQARSQATWGKGLALRATGRCDEAKKAFDDYAGMQSKNAGAVSEAQQMAAACRSGGAAVQPVPGR